MKPRRELTWSDVPALGFAAAGIVGAAAALLISVSPGALYIFVVLSTTISLIALATVKRRLVAIGLAYVALTGIVCFRGSSDIARNERQTFVAHISDTAIVQCRGVVVWKDDASAEGRTSRLLLSDLRIAFPDTTVTFTQSRLRLSLPAHLGGPAEIGDVVACDARVISASDYQQKSVRELCWTLRDRLIGTALLANDESLVIVRGNYNTRRWLYDVRNALFEIFKEHLRPDARAVAGALLLGSRTAFSSEFRQDLQITGLAHLFALSGLNTGLLVSLFWLLLGWLRVPRIIRYALLLILLAVYTGLGLGVPSLFRSSMMASLLIISRLLARPSHPVNLLLFAAGIELLIWPLHVLDAGFHLSYLSMAGIIAAYLALHKPFQDLVQTRNQTLAARTVDTLSSTLGAQLATSPTVALMFGRVPGLAMIINVVAIPIFSLLLVLILVLLVFAHVSTFLAAAISRSIEALVSLFTTMTGSAAGIVGASFSSHQEWGFAASAVLVQWSAIISAYVGRSAVALLLCLLAINLLLWPSHFQSPNQGRIVSIGDQSSECYFIHFGDLNFLIGGGSEWASERRADQLQDELQRVGAAKLDALVIFDRKAQNIGAAPRLVEVGHPDIVIDFSSARDTKTSERLDAACLLNGVELQKAQFGQMWQVEQSKVVVTSFEQGRAPRTGLTLSDDRQCISIVYADSPLDEGDRRITFSLCDKANTSLKFSSAVREWVLDHSSWRSHPPKAVELMKVMSLPTSAAIL